VRATVIKTEEEYKSVVKLADFLVDMIQGEQWPDSFMVLCRLIEDWENKTEDMRNNTI